jgi:hypothetical protein
MGGLQYHCTHFEKAERTSRWSISQHVVAVVVGGTPKARLVGRAGREEGIARLRACMSMTGWDIRATRPLLRGEYTVGDPFRTTAHAFKYGLQQPRTVQMLFNRSASMRTEVKDGVFCISPQEGIFPRPRVDLSLGRIELSPFNVLGGWPKPLWPGKRIERSTF